MWSRGLVIVAALCLMVGCDTHDYGEQRVSIAHLRAMYEGYPRLITEPLVIEGEVVSSDRYGAFPRQLVIQDPTGGVVILIDSPSLYATLSVGDVVRVWCEGLTLGGYGGSVRLGGAPERDWQVSRLTPVEWAEHSLWVGSHTSAECAVRSISTLGASDMGRYVRIEGVRVVGGGRPWPEEGVSENLEVVDLTTPTDTLLVRITGHEDLEGAVVPAGACSVRGVADYFAGDYQITLLSPEGFWCEE